MPKKIYKAEEIINLLRQIEILISQGQTAQTAARGVGISEQTYYRWTTSSKNMGECEQIKRSGSRNLNRKTAGWRESLQIWPLSILTTCGAVILWWIKHRMAGHFACWILWMNLPVQVWQSRSSAISNQKMYWNAWLNCSVRKGYLITYCQTMDRSFRQYRFANG